MLKYLVTLRPLSYKEKLKKVKLLSLRARRIKQQILTAFKIKNKGMSLSFDDFFEEEAYKKTRGNVFKLHPPRTKTKLHRNFLHLLLSSIGTN